MLNYKVCSRCKTEKSIYCFYKEKWKGHLSPHCYDCQRKSNRVYLSKVKSKWDHIVSVSRRYNITDYNIMLKNQGYKCAICDSTNPGKGLKYFVVDHDHACCPGKKSCGKCVRALLCNGCNTGLGHFKDNPISLEWAARYINYHKKKSQVKS